MKTARTHDANLHEETVDGFGAEWSAFDQSELDQSEANELFAAYFSVFPWESLPSEPVGFDLGCGSGRWARLAAQRVAHLHCIDASVKALRVAQRNLRDHSNTTLACASVGALPIRDESMDFGYALGVLHHVPDTAAGIAACVQKLKPGAPFLVYLYYSFDNRPVWYRWIWRASDLVRHIVSRLPIPIRHLISASIAATVYLPIARTARVLERAGMNVSHLPLAHYRELTFYTIRTDALDRFGTQLEQRFSQPQIRAMMENAGLVNVIFSDAFPFWCAIGFRKQ